MLRARGPGAPWVLTVVAVPEVYGVDEATGHYLEEDLGDTTLFRALTAAREAGFTAEHSIRARSRPST